MTRVQAPELQSGCLYAIEENVKGTWRVCYIGQTVNQRKRWNHHRQKGQATPSKPDKRFLLHRAMHSHGLEHFRFSVLLEARVSSLDHLEQLFIEMFRTHRDHGSGGYNLDRGGRRNRGAFSLQSRRKMAESQKARWVEGVKRQEWATSIKALHARHPEIRARMSKSRADYLAANPEVLRRQSDRMRAVHASNPQLAFNHSCDIRKLWGAPEFHQRMIEAQKSSYSENPNRALGHSATMKKKWSEDAYRGRLSTTHKARYANQEAHSQTAAACQASQLVRNVTGFKGVYKHGKGWGAHIKSNKKTIYLGTYSNPELAAQAYNDAALSLFGPGAFQNQIERH